LAISRNAAPTERALFQVDLGRDERAERAWPRSIQARLGLVSIARRSELDRLQGLAYPLGPIDRPCQLAEYSKIKSILHRARVACLRASDRRRPAAATAEPPAPDLP
jgi:hypothetical protein